MNFSLGNQAIRAESSNRKVPAGGNFGEGQEPQSFHSVVLTVESSGMKHNLRVKCFENSTDGISPRHISKD